jgi:hypothetical protein
MSPSTDIDSLLMNPKIIESQFMDALEYGRMVHAEMGALCDAARLGHAVRGGKLLAALALSERALGQWKLKPHEMDGRAAEIETGLLIDFTPAGGVNYSKGSWSPSNGRG